MTQIKNNYLTKLNPNLADSYFAPPERSSEEELEIDLQTIGKNPLIKELLEGFPELAMIINENRQIVAYNSKTVDYVPEALRDHIYGKRHGEAINCIHANDKETGCGTTKFCAECGAAKALVNTLSKNIADVEECRITRKIDSVEESLDLRVHTSNITIEGKKYTLFSVKDIADEKRRHVLEKIFFHDILNTAGALNGLVQLLPDSGKEELEDLEKILGQISSQLINEIKAQQQLLSAETGKLVPDLTTLSLNTVLNAAGNLYRGHKVAKGKKISVTLVKSDVEFESDITLLVRSIGNLIKNALEASESGDEIKITAEVFDNEICFRVWNNFVMPPSVQLQIFQRSFSTKSLEGRGIGTYSVKLLVEQYLNGQVSFFSNKEEKTTFTITLPR